MERIDARNGLENYIYSVKSSVDDAKLKDKLSEEERSTIEAACKESQEWLESATNSVSVDDYAAQQKKLEGIVAPIVSKLYEQSSQPGQQTQQTQPAGSKSQGPNIEEVD